MQAAPLLREKKEERRVSGERISSRAALVFFFGVADATAGSLDRHQERRTGEEPRAIVFFVCSLAEATHRTFASRLARSDSIVAVRTGLEQPVSESFSEPPPHAHIDCSTLVFLSSSSQPLSLNLNLSPSLPTPSLSLPFSFHLNAKNSPHPPLPWAAPTKTGPRSPQRPSSA